MSSEAEWGVGGVLKGRAQGCGSGLDEAMLVRINNGPRPVPAFQYQVRQGVRTVLLITVFYAYSRLQAGLLVIIKK